MKPIAALAIGAIAGLAVSGAFFYGLICFGLGDTLIEDW